MKNLSVRTLGKLLSVLLILCVNLTGCQSNQEQASSPTAENREGVQVVDVGADYVYQVNENGQTYGSDSGAPYGEWPDLVRVESDQGDVGYVYSSELYGEEPTSIEEALASQSDGPRILTVYEDDGITEIGTFTTNKG